MKQKKIVSCSSADEGDSNIDPTHKAIREKERRQANNVRERYVTANLQQQKKMKKQKMSTNSIIYNILLYSRFYIPCSHSEYRMKI